MMLYSVYRVEVAPEMEKWAALALRNVWPIVPFPLRHLPYPHGRAK